MQIQTGKQRTKGATNIRSGAATPYPLQTSNSSKHSNETPKKTVNINIPLTFFLAVSRLRSPWLLPFVVSWSLKVLAWCTAVVVTVSRDCGFDERRCSCCCSRDALIASIKDFPHRKNVRVTMMVMMQSAINTKAMPISVRSVT